MVMKLATIIIQHQDLVTQEGWRQINLVTLEFTLTIQDQYMVNGDTKRSEAEEITSSVNADDGHTEDVDINRRKLEPQIIIQITFIFT